MSKRAKEAAMRYVGYDHIPNRSDELNDREKVDSYYSYLDGYEQAEKDFSHIIIRLAESILFNWNSRAEIAKEALKQIEDYE